MFSLFFLFSLSLSVFSFDDESRIRKEKRETKKKPTKYYDMQIVFLFFVSYFFLGCCRSLLLILFFLAALIYLSSWSIFHVSWSYRYINEIPIRLRHCLTSHISPISTPRPWKKGSPIGQRDVHHVEISEEIKGPALAAVVRMTRKIKMKKPKFERKKRPGACAIYDRRLVQKKKREIR